MFGSENRVPVKPERFADCLFLRVLLLSQSECVGGITRAAVRCDRFVERKNTPRFGGGLFSVFETTLMIAGLDVMMGQLLNCTRRRFAAALQAFCNVTMQAPAPDRIQQIGR